MNLHHHHHHHQLNVDLNSPLIPLLIFPIECKAATTFDWEWEPSTRQRWGKSQALRVYIIQCIIYIILYITYVFNIHYICFILYFVYIIL